MTDSPAMIRVVPILPVRELDAALDRYRRRRTPRRNRAGGERYGFVQRGPVELHLSESPGHDPLSTASMVYLYVENADAVHAAWSAAGVEGRLGEPRDTAWGLREFAYVDPDGTMHRVGSKLA